MVETLKEEKKVEVQKRRLRVSLDQVLALSVPVLGAVALGEAILGNPVEAVTAGAAAILGGREVIKRWS